MVKKCISPSPQNVLRMPPPRSHRSPTRIKQSGFNTVHIYLFMFLAWIETKQLNSPIKLFLLFLKFFFFVFLLLLLLLLRFCYLFSASKRSIIYQSDDLLDISFQCMESYKIAQHYCNTMGK